MAGHRPAVTEEGQSLGSQRTSAHPSRARGARARGPAASAPRLSASGIWVAALGAALLVMAVLFALFFRLPGAAVVERAAAVGHALAAAALAAPGSDDARRAASATVVDRKLAELRQTVAADGHGPSGLATLEKGWQQARNDSSGAGARALLPVAEALTHELRLATDEQHLLLEVAIKALVAALLLLLIVPVHGLWRQRRRVKSSLNQFSDNLGQQDWQDAVQALRDDRQGPPSAFDALATGVAGVLGESDRRWQALADLSADWYWETDAQHRLVRLFGSVSLLRELGWRPDDVVGWRHDQIAFFRAPQPAGWDGFHAVLGSAKPFRDLEFEIISRDRRSLRHVAVSGRARTDVRGEFAGYEGVGRDVTERQRAVARLQASEQRWAAMVGLASDWYWETDAQHRVLPLPPELHRRFGPLAEQLEGRTHWEAHPGAMSAAQWAELRADLEARRPFRSLQLVIDQADREAPMWLSLSGVPRIDAAGRFRGYHGVGRDISARKQAEHVLMRHNETLQRAVAEHTRELQLVNRDLDAFARQLAHELRTPIGHVQGLAHLLQTRAGNRLEAEDRNLLDLQVQAAHQMRETVDALLQLARSTMQPMPTEPVDLSGLVHEVIDALPALDRLAPLQWQVQAGMQVVAAPGPLRIVIANLLANAAKFTRRSARPLVRVSGTADTDGRLRIAVEDNGVGFDPQFASRLFTPFGRLHSGDDYHGTGIGLTIVQRIIERHGGTVLALGERNQGARFEFTLAQPAVKAREPNAAGAGAEALLR
jgi:PAS domain S-box-containing protein